MLKYGGVDMPDSPEGTPFTAQQLKDIDYSGKGLLTSKADKAAIEKLFKKILVYEYRRSGYNPEEFLQSHRFGNKREVILKDLKPGDGHDYDYRQRFLREKEKIDLEKALFKKDLFE